ncbi:MAG TPA: TylF/MycF/NovP-related O-methyltransferase [Nitrosopumilaceae archaeon]|nr:TylF/MycF/NovP-related O-methyltransferase [Nitrosopumilaceae archaeon]
MIKSIKNEVDFAFFPLEAFAVYSVAKSQSKLEGDMAEVGVFQGGSAKLICEAKGNGKLHLFDTFEGLPELSDKDTHFGVKYWKKSQFGNTSVENVKKYLSKYSNVFYYKGTFPETANPITDLKFSFVHIDVDLYQSTMDCLKFFLPRLVQGGIILSHDYHTGGVRSAFDEFFKEKKIPIVELPGPQCMVINNSANF